MQSVNLRSALLRGLETAKRNGALGRDSIIRKTMLDECKGERLEDVLACFSTAVLKKVSAQSTVVSLACENRGYASDDTDLHVFLLAHKAALRRQLERKQGARATYADFDDLLRVKERGLARRAEAIRVKEADSARDTLSKNAREEMRRLVRSNWSGSDEWMKVLVQGEADTRGGYGLFAMPFDKVWRRVQHDRLGELEDGVSGLLEQLDSRVRPQNNRLERWQAFKDEMFGDAILPPQKEHNVRKREGVDFAFGEHKALQVGRVQSTQAPFETTPEYKHLVQGLQQSLEEARGGNALHSLMHVPMPNPRPAELETLDISDIDDVETHTPTPRATRARLQRFPRQPTKPQLTRSEVFNQSTSTTSSSDSPEGPRPQRMQQSPTREEPAPVPSPEQRRPRHTLSLAQRTRLSMAGDHSPFLDEEPELPSKPEPVPEEPETSDNQPIDLVARTRLSMAGFEKAQKKAQLERRRSQRQSRAPRKTFVPTVDEMPEQDHTMLTEELMGAEDMEAVFKSRPRIKASPVPSPTREWDEYE